MGGNSSQSFDQIKRAFNDLVRELHARKLAIPAGALLVAILAAIFVLPKSPTPPPPATSAPVADTNQTVDTEAVVSLKLVGVSPLDNDVPLADSSDPFNGKASTKCVRVGKSTPKVFECAVGDLLVKYTCLPGVTDGICGDGPSGATGSSAASGSAPVDGGGSTGSTGGGGGGGTKPHKKTTYYVANVTLDGRKYSNLIAGDGVPNEKTSYAIFAGVSNSATKALFIAGDGVTVTGVEVDPDLGNFQLSKGQTVTLTDKVQAQHTLTLKSIVKVTK